MGALSLPPEQAISWTTHPGNALWFAIHSGQGTKVAVARVRPEQIVAHYPSYAEENEVVIFPGTVTAVSYTHLDVYKRQSPRNKLRGKYHLASEKKVGGGSQTSGIHQDGGGCRL